MARLLALPPRSRHRERAASQVSSPMAELSGEAQFQGGDLSAEGDVIYEGALDKKKTGKKLQPRHCSLVLASGGGNPRLVYREAVGKKPKGVLNLHGAWVRKTADDATFEVLPCHQVNKASRSQPFQFKADSDATVDAWIAQIGAIPDVNQPLDSDELCTVNYDALAKEDDELVTDLVAMAVTLGVDKLLGKAEADLRKYFDQCRVAMNDCPFHNFKHAADVTQMLYYLLRSTGLSSLLSPVQIVSIFLAAPAHDLDHRGHTIQFERATGSDIGRGFGDKPLEAHHTKLATELLEQLGMYSGLSEGSRAEAMECVGRCIMTTDMSMHVDIMKQFKESESELLGAKHTAADFFTHGDKGMLLLGVLLKAADISNPSRPREIANKWNRLCYDEFFAEGAANRSAGREVLPLHDPVNDTPIAIAKASVGFIDFAVSSVFTELLKYMEAAAMGQDAPGVRPEGVKTVLDSLATNRKAHAAIAAAEEGEPEPEAAAIPEGETPPSKAAAAAAAAGAAGAAAVADLKGQKGQDLKAKAAAKKAEAEALAAKKKQEAQQKVAAAEERVLLASRDAKGAAKKADKLGFGGAKGKAAQNAKKAAAKKAGKKKK